MKKNNNYFPRLPEEEINKLVEDMKKNKCGDFSSCSDCQKEDCLECCDECQRGLCMKCLGLYHGSEYLFYQGCFNEKSDEEKAIMKGEKKAKLSSIGWREEKMSKQYAKN